MMTNESLLFQGDGIPRDLWPRLDGHLVKIPNTDTYYVVGDVVGKHVTMLDVHLRMEKHLTCITASSCLEYVGSSSCSQFRLLQSVREEAPPDLRDRLGAYGLLLPDMALTVEQLRPGGGIRQELWSRLQWHVVRHQAGNDYAVRWYRGDTVGLSLLRARSQRQHTFAAATRLFAYVGGPDCAEVRQSPFYGELTSDRLREEQHSVERRPARRVVGESQPAPSRRRRAPRVPKIQPPPPGRVLRIPPPLPPPEPA